MEKKVSELSIVKYKKKKAKIDGKKARDDTKYSCIKEEKIISNIEKENIKVNIRFIEIIYANKKESKYLFILRENKILNKRIRPMKLKSNQIPDYKFTDIDVNLNKENKLHYKTYKNAPQCITDPLGESNIKLIKSTKQANLIWKLYPYEKMIKVIKNLNIWQKYNHFPKTFQLGRKDNLWNNYRKLNKLFPQDYTYMPKTFIFPRDTWVFQNEKKDTNTIWIVKPVNSSRGRGIHLLTGQLELAALLSNTKQEHLMSRYIHNPHLINNKKYDLRIYVLITSFTPLKIYIYEEGLVRFASENYTKSNRENIFIHLTNYAINKNNSNYMKNNLEDNEKPSPCSKWSLTEYKNYFTENKLETEHKLIFERIQDIIIKTVITVSEQNSIVVKNLTKNRDSLFELHGFDIIIDDNFKPWLLEVNTDPSLNCDSQLDLSIKSDLITDIVNLLGIQPFNNEIDAGSTPHDEYINKINECKTSDRLLKQYLSQRQMISKFKVKVCKEFSTNKANFELTLDEKLFVENSLVYQKMINSYLGELIRSQFGKFFQIFPKDNVSIHNYSKFFLLPGDENILLWKWILFNTNE